MIFKDAMNSWNKHRIMDVFKGGEIIKKTEEIIYLLTGKITDINILNSNIINLTKLTQPLSENQPSKGMNHGGRPKPSTFPIRV